MRLFGLTVTREKAISQLAAVEDRGWRRVISEAFGGAWQKNVEIRRDAVLSFHAVFACQTLIASDISKLRVKLVQQDATGIWEEVKSPAYSPVLRKPNAYQSRMQFFENWVLSKLQSGNTYVLKQRDNRGVVIRLYVLDPARVKPLVADDGSVYYQLQADNLASIGDLIVPAREIIHDRFNCFFHPLVGLSPIFANGLASTQGLAIQNNSARFFQNGSQPGGILTAPGNIDQKDADRLKSHWDNEYTGANAGKIAVLGSGLKYEPLTTKAVDAQLIEQLRWTSDVVCSTYHVPPYKIGIGQQPTYNNVQALNTEYYSQCLQVLIESIELCLDEGLSTGETLGTEFDVDNLLRMDSVTQMQVLKEGAGILKIDEMRAKLDKKPTEGGNAVYLQQQNYSLAALAKRDAQGDPFAIQSAQPTAEPANDNADEQARQARAFAALFEKDLREALNA
jgi:HK97 family phage portal protein